MAVANRAADQRAVLPHPFRRLDGRASSSAASPPGSGRARTGAPRVARARSCGASMPSAHGRICTPRSRIAKAPERRCPAAADLSILLDGFGVRSSAIGSQDRLFSDESATRPFMSTLVKICGLNDARRGRRRGQGRRRHGRLRRLRQSPRHVSLDQAAASARGSAPAREKLLLTVDADDASLAAAIAALDPAFLQLHGTRRPSAWRRSARFRRQGHQGDRHWRAGDLDLIRAYDEIADMLLFDALAARGRDAPRRQRRAVSTGRFSPASRRKSPGCSPAGSTPETSGEALRETRAPGVDVSSGVESARGRQG